MPILRLDRMLSGQGIGTRREIKDLLCRGAVTVNGSTATSPAVKIDPEKDEVRVKGKPVSYREHVYIMMNKPAGAVSASNEPREKTVIDLLPRGLSRPGLFPAGRLDRDTEGFLLITDDGNFAHNILSPKKHVEKEYLAVIDGPVTAEQSQQFSKGLAIDGGVTCLPAKLKTLGKGSDGFHVLVTISEGKYHQIKRMFEALGLQVLHLKRTAMGGLCLDPGLAPGQARLLNSEEIELIAGQNEQHR